MAGRVEVQVQVEVQIEVEVQLQIEVEEALGWEWRGAFRISARSFCAKKYPQPEPGAVVLIEASAGVMSAHQPSTFTVTVLTVFALGAVTVSSPSR